ncbi:unnamed protein product [Rotaria sp. Silwood2]|nr:unnamed protein product [Rotaria sp. Silwood2]
MGCISSKHTTVTRAPSIVKYDSLQIQKDTSTQEQQNTRFIENCMIVWFVDPAATPEKETVLAHLRHIVCTLRIYTDQDACVTFMTNICEEKIFLIIPSGMNSFVERIRHLRQIEKIYIFDGRSNNINQEIFRLNLSTLCEQLRQDVELCELDYINITATPPLTSNSDSTKQTAEFLYAQLMKELLCRFKLDDNVQNIFLNFCRQHYAHDNEQLSTIADFEQNYRPEKALVWLNRSCFISRMLHRAQRAREVDVLHKMGFFMKHMHIQISNVYEQIFALTQNPVVVYRGKTMLNNEFEILVKNNCGGLLSCSTFLITSVDKNVAMNFLRRRIATHADRIAILFEIHADPMKHNTTSPFASLDNIDLNEESENGKVCFTLSVIFRIESVAKTDEQSMNNMWTVKLTLIDDHDPHVHHLIEPLRSNDVYANPIFRLGKLHITMGDYDRAEEFYHKILADMSVLNRPHRLSLMQKGLGSIFMYKGEHNKAIGHLHEALKVSLSYLPSDHPDLASIYTMIGSCYSHMDNYVLALDNYKRAMQLMQNNIQSVNQQSVDDLHSCIVHFSELLEHQK